MVSCGSLGKAHNIALRSRGGMFKRQLLLNSELNLRKMSASLVATGWWMYVDVPSTPNAVVVCVILFNAFFGYRSVCRKPGFTVSQIYPFTAGALFHGSTLPRCVVIIFINDFLSHQRTRLCHFLSAPRAYLYLPRQIGSSILS
jgi:hypothetical protein